MKQLSPEETEGMLLFLQSYDLEFTCIVTLNPFRWRIHFHKLISLKYKSFRVHVSFFFLHLGIELINYFPAIDEFPDLPFAEGELVSNEN